MENIHLKIAEKELEILEKQKEILEKQKSILNLKVDIPTIEKEDIPSENFSVNGQEAVKELIDLIKDKYKFMERRYGKWYKIKNINTEYLLVIENYKKGRTDYGLLTTYAYHRCNYSEESKKIISTWDNYGRSTKRKQYDYRGKNKNDILKMIEILLG